jgi:hypothetical protein
MADFTELQNELTAINERAEQIRLELDEQRHGLMAGIREYVGTDEQTFRELVTELSIMGQTRFDLTVLVRRPRVKVDKAGEIPYQDTDPATE